jgi:hypothetical protein
MKNDVAIVGGGPGGVDRFIESHFGIQIEDTDLMQENFQTRRALTKFIETRHSELHS